MRLMAGAPPAKTQQLLERFVSAHLLIYRVVFLTGPPNFQYQNEKTCSANGELDYIENFVKN